MRTFIRSLLLAVLLVAIGGLAFLAFGQLRTAIAINSDGDCCSDDMELEEGTDPLDGTSAPTRDTWCAALDHSENGVAGTADIQLGYKGQIPSVVDSAWEIETDLNGIPSPNGDYVVTVADVMFYKGAIPRACLPL